MLRPRRSALARTAGAVILGLGAAVAAVHFGASGCSGWDPNDPFTRHSPEVDEAVTYYEAGDLEPAERVLARYLGTGPCSEEGLGLTDLVRKRPDGSFDLGLTLFRLGERFGKPFGEEGSAVGDDGEPLEPTEDDRQRSIRIDCALVVARAIASDQDVAAELRARAWYLAGNLEFLRRKYEDAVRAYDQALRIVPGLEDDAGVDGLGRDAAHNRAIALRRIEEQKDAGPPDAEPDAPPDAEPDAPPDAEPDAGPDAEPDAGPDGGDGDGDPEDQDAGPDGGEPQDTPDGGGEPDAGPDGGGEEPQDQQPDAGDSQDGDQDPQDPNGEPPPGEPEGAPKDPERRQGERVLDQFEEAPSYQEQEARRRAGRGRRTMEDK